MKPLRRRNGLESIRLSDRTCRSIIRVRDFCVFEFRIPSAAHILVCFFWFVGAVAAAILGVYTGFFGLYKIKSAMTKKPVAEEVPVKVASTSTVPTGSIPDVDSPEFEKFLENVLENEDQLKALLEKAN